MAQWAWCSSTSQKMTFKVQPLVQLFRAFCPVTQTQLCLIAVKQGDRIAQLILERIATPDVVEVEDLDSTDRGQAGFGSTGGFGQAA